MIIVDKGDAMNCYVIAANDSIECVVIGSEADADAKRDECKAKYAAARPWMDAHQLDRMYWHWHLVPLFQTAGTTL